MKITHLFHLLLLSFLLTFLPRTLFAQVDTLSVSADNTSTAYNDVPRPSLSKQTLRRLEEWKDLKFGVFFRWGLYSIWGAEGSWSLCSEPWVDRKGVPYDQFKTSYFDLNRLFKPKKFDPDQWAKIAANAKARYFFITAKDYDGFCLFNSAETDYSSANSSCPFFRNKYSDITGSLIDAFRKRNFWIGISFSKADWHHQDYWAPEWATPDRNVNYDPFSFPERWRRYSDFVYNQINELTHNYGPIDMLLLDAPWVQPTGDRNGHRDYRAIPQDINLPRIAKMAIDNNPQILFSEFMVPGNYEYYRSFELHYPDHLFDIPWEVSIPIGNSWSYTPNDTYKSAHSLIHTLVDVVAHGGNLLLDIGPDPSGKIPEPVISALSEIGDWLKSNGVAIFDSRPLYPYADGKMRFTQSRDGSHRYLIYLLDDNEAIPSKLPYESRSLRVIKKTRHAVVAEIK